jgi:predicted transposase YdaD
MAEVIEAYRSVTASDEFKELERLRDRAGHNEAAALRSAVHKDRMKIAKKMNADGMDAATIAKFTGLTVDEILGL